MKVEIRDSAVLRALLPIDVTAYLRSHAWVQQTEQLGRVSVWHPEHDADIEVEVPGDQTLADFAARMADVLQAISQVEDRSQLQVLYDLMESGHDVVRLRAATPGAGETGTIAINAGVQLIGNARDMLLAAASATAERKGFFPTRKPPAAVEYMDRVRLGRSEIGSYVVTLLSPVAPLLRSALRPDLGLEEPFDRRVTVMLARSLGALRMAANDAVMTGAFDSFQASVEQGVTANLCTAVAGMTEGLGDGGELTVGLSWSPVRPLLEDVPRQTRFGPDVAPIIREAARVIKAAAPIDDHHVVGFVVHLDQLPQAEKGRIGVLSVAADQSTRTISMTLDAEQYAVAHRAHGGDKLPVSVVGRLVRIGHLFQLEDPHDFRIVDPDTEQDEPEPQA
jgi:hypothetical protein